MYDLYCVLRGFVVVVVVVLFACFAEDDDKKDMFWHNMSILKI